jgi:hypothetical protein
MTRLRFPGEWPLTADRATLICIPRGAQQLAIARIDGIDYALNGTALAQHPTARAIEPVWLDNAQIDGAKINIGDLLTFTRALCRAPSPPAA